MVDGKFYKNLGPISLGELIDGLDVEIPEGQFADIQINNATPVDQAGVSDISFFEGRRAKLALENCKAEVCLISEKNAQYVGANNTLAIISKSPRADFTRVLDRLYQPLPFNGTVAEFDAVSIATGAAIGEGATIGKGTIIGPNTVIGPGVKIGENCKIGANAVIQFAELGDNCKVHSGAVIGGSGFGVAMTPNGSVDIPHVGIVEIGNNVSVGCLTAIDRAMFGATKIGDGCKFDNFVQVAHNVQIGTNCIFAGHVGLSGSCVIGNNVLMGGRVGIPDHVKIGDNVVMAANSATMRDLPSDSGAWSGVPAQPIREHMREVTAIRKLVSKKKG